MDISLLSGTDSTLHACRHIVYACAYVRGQPKKKRKKKTRKTSNNNNLFCHAGCAVVCMFAVHSCIFEYMQINKCDNSLRCACSSHHMFTRCHPLLFVSKCHDITEVELQKNFCEYWGVWGGLKGSYG